MCQPEFMYFNLDVVAKLWNNEYLYICKTSNKIIIEIKVFPLKSSNTVSFYKTSVFSAAWKRDIPISFRGKGTHTATRLRARIYSFLYNNTRD
jgi:hypothetical protein